MALSTIRAFFEEAKRRRIWVSVVAYVAVGGGIIQLSDPVADALLLPDWTPRLITVLVILGLPLVLALAWVFDLTFEGVKRTPPADGHEDLGRSGRTAHPPGAARAPSSRGPVPKPPAPGRRPVPIPEALEEPPDPLRVQRAALGHMRHELRTPINGILGYAEMVLEEVDDPAIVADLGRIREAGRTLLALVDEILSPEALSTSEDRNLESFGSRMRAELRNPVNAIIGYVEIVMEAASETGRGDLLGDLERIRGAARRLLESGEELLSTVARPGGEGHVVHGALRESSRLTHGVLSRIRPMGDREVVLRVEREGRILVVDDNVMSRDLLSRGLARAGYMVTEAEDGQSALALLEEQTFDVILLDVIMPRLNGVETLLRLRSRDHLAEIPVVMLSSLDEVDAVVRCIELGAEEYLVKPVPPSVLEARVAANVELRRVRNLSREYHDRLQQDEIFIEDLLARWVPARFAPRVRAGEQIVEESYPEATAVCCLLGRGSTAPAGIRSLYPRLEALMEEVGVEMSLWRPGRLVALAEASGERPYHAEVVADLALALAGALESSGEPATFRMGIHTGPAAGGILGGARFRFELWGEAVELAEKLAVSAPEAGIVVTTSTHGALRGAYALESRGITEVEGGGRMRIYQLHGRAQKGNLATPAQG